MEQLSISQQIEQIKEEMCDKYCRYPQDPIPEGKDEDWLFEEDSPCSKCPLDRL